MCINYRLMAKEPNPLSREEYFSVLKSHSLKATPQRLAVHEAMLALGHASADMVNDYIREHSSTRVTTASVYNILAQLALFGVYKHRLSANNRMYFDVSPSRHIHLYDMVSNEYKDVLDDELMDEIEGRLKRRRFKGYKVDGIDIQIICHPIARRKA